jgi:tetratricopeptide (TPR) repeat protein
VKVPFQLRRCERHAATALLLPGDVEAVLRLCARITEVSLPVLHDVAAGFLIRLPAASEEVFPGAIRLRALAENLFVPADAELTPALLQDEARALVQKRGLVFLPGGKVLAFAPEVALSPADLIALPRLPRRGWRPLPEPPARPEELREIVLDLPDPPASLFLDEAGGDIGAEPVAPPAAGPGNQASGQAKALLGQGLFWLGSKLSWKRLASLGAGLVQKALEQAPQISERVLGKQESALRELLRQFKEGRVEDALRRALPLGHPGGRGATPAQDAHLPTHGLGYRLADFLGLPRGPAGVWLGGGSVYDELQREYRKAADDAIRRGDFLRAAVIYGKLLQDWPRMASMLARSGLHHDAALVYLQKLDDAMQAAREFEAAGEFDRALEIYARRGDHLAAGDLLRRIGEAERAVEEYLSAARREAARGHHTQAARLLLARAQRPDLAEAFLLTGWERRPSAEAVGCLHELKELYVHQRERAKLLRLIEEAEEYFAAPGEDHAVGKFASGLAVLADGGAFPELSEELRDRALMMLAKKLGQRGRVGDRGSGVVAMLFGGQPWEPSLVRDAEVALRGLPRAEGARRVTRRQRTHHAEVAAACAARETGDLFLGFADGTFVELRPRTGEMTVVRTDPAAVVGLSCDAAGSLVVLVREDESGKFSLSSYWPDRGVVTAAPLGPRRGEHPPMPSNVAECCGERVVVLWDGESLEYRCSGERLSPAGSGKAPPEILTAVLLNQRNPITTRTSVVAFGIDGFVPVTSGLLDRSVLTPLPWVAATPGLPGLPWLAWQQVQRTLLEVVVVTREGQLGWAALKVFTRDKGVQEAGRSHQEARYLAATILPSGLVAGVHRGGVSWFRPGRDRLRLVAQTQADLHDAVACFGSPATNELLVVCRHGDLVRVPVPG